MKRNLSIIIIFSAFALSGFVLIHKASKNIPENRLEAPEHENPADGFREFAEYEFDLLKDPVTGKIPEGVYQAEIEAAMAAEKIHESNEGDRNKTTGPGVWASKGPSNLGGRTRSIGIDIANNNIMLAGCVSGGIMRTTNGGTSWTNVTPFLNLKSITSICQDTRSGQTSTWYFCTGEAYGNSAGANGAFYFGNGVYKSTDNGVSWTRLTNSNTGADESFDNRADLCWRVAVNPQNGDVYLAATNAIFRSTNGGTSWTNVLSGTFSGSTQATDIAITPGGTMYAAFSGYAGATTQDGIWSSTNGTTWGRIAGNATPATWSTAGNYGRIVLALDTSSTPKLYALYDNFISSSCAGTAAPEADLFVYNINTSTWTDLSANLPDEGGCLDGNDPFAIQGGYDLCIVVKPGTPTTLFIGGTNVYRSTNGFTSTAATTRIGGYNSAASYAQYSNHHPDVHELKFGSGSITNLYTGDDGGIQRADITVSTPAWTSLNNSYQSYQYYNVALDPTTSSTRCIGGAQDNGTTQILTGVTTATSINSGDGCAVGMSAGGTFNYSASQSGNMSRNGTNITPASNKSLFVTNFHLDPDNTSLLYYANGNDLYRATSATTVTAGSGWTVLSGLATAVTTSFKIYGIATSRGTYSSNAGVPTTLSRLYAGTNNGQLFRLDDPQNVAAATAPSNITPTSMTGLGTIVDIAVDPTDSRKVMCVYSNYSVNSVWYTSDASVASPTWTNVEGTTINAFSFRSCAILSNGTTTDYMVGTSKGLYSAIALNGSSTIWRTEASGLIGYTPVVSLDYRVADQTILAGSHGNGMFISSSYPLPLRFVNFDARILSPLTAKLTWTVANENNISSYEALRSFDGKSWESIGTINATHAGTQSVYTADDNISGRTGTVYYRIRAVEYSGDAYTSVIQSISIPASFAQAVNIYPTVVPQYLHLDANKSGYVAQLTDIRGRQLAAVRLNAGSNTHDLSPLSAGQYLVSVYDNGRLVTTSRIVRQ